MKARILDITPEQYHADPCATPSLSVSIAKKIVEKSSRHAFLAHPRLGGGQSAHTKAMDDGSIIHRILLGKGTEVVEIHADDYRKAFAQELRDACYESGKVPVLSARYAQIQVAAEAIRAQMSGLGIEFSGSSEVAIEWEEELFMSSETVLCRCMMDHVLLDCGVIFEVKKIVSADLDSISSAIYKYGYDIQRAAYTSALRHLRPEFSGREDFQFLFCEIEPPYVLTPVRPDGEFRAMGDRRWERAKSIWHRCISSGEWPGYTDRVMTVGPPGWALAKEMERGYAAE